MGHGNTCFDGDLVKYRTTAAISPCLTYGARVGHIYEKN